MTLTGFLFCFTMGFAQAKKAAAAPAATPKKLTMTWTTKSKPALALAESGVSHYMNNEFAEAYSDLKSAIKLDPNFTIALGFMSLVTTGATKQSYQARTIRSAANKTTGEKLFATLSDEKNTEEINRGIWDKLHTMFPDGFMIGYYYAFTRATDEERFTASQNYIRQFPDEPAMYNNLGYYYFNKKDNENAKKNFEKYISLYKDGCNPYDSMGEFYMKTDDNVNAIKYYTMALEKYPFFQSSIDALAKLKPAK